MRFHRFGDKIIFIPSMSIFSSLYSTDEKFSYCGGEINIYVLYVGDMFISYDAQFILTYLTTLSLFFLFCSDSI